MNMKMRHNLCSTTIYHNPKSTIPQPFPGNHLLHNLLRAAVVAGFVLLLVGVGYVAARGISSLADAMSRRLPVPKAANSPRPRDMSISKALLLPILDDPALEGGVHRRD